LDSLPTHPTFVKSITIGDVFGRLTVIGDPVRANGRWHYPCRCTCGTEKLIRHGNLLGKRYPTRSCGCSSRENALKALTTHSETDTRLYNIWRGICKRCLNTNDSNWKHYGARGIRICEEWASSYEVFALWARANGYHDELTIERVDNDGHYEPANCRWATYREQARNRRNNHILEAFGESKTIAAWVEDMRCQVQYKTLLYRSTQSNWDAERAITTPSIHRA